MEIGSKVHELGKRILWQFHIGDSSEVCMLTFVPVMKGFTLWSGFLSSLFVCGATNLYQGRFMKHIFIWTGTLYMCNFGC